ncbi:gag-pol polyprotein [Tanacetum coccineum]|uniref:Gag-pol polyprotein n=1 Tax=Tanacetum coccineum TaxID=301880 RepID=A0ABQ5ILL0_9ASTR
MGTIRFRNDHFAAITGYGDYVQGNLTICHVNYGPRTQLIFSWIICDGDLELAASSPVCLMSKATSTKSCLWHRRLSHLNFGTINQLTPKDLIDGIPKFKYDKDHLCSACEQGKKFLWAEAIAIACFTQNHSIIHTRYNKTPYELIQERKPNVQYFHVFGSLCYPRNDHDDLGKMKPKADIGIFIGYSESSRDNSAENTLDNEDTPSSSSIIVEEDKAHQIVSSSKEPIANELNTPVLNENADEQIQEHVADLDGNTIMHSFEILEFREAESSSNYQDPSNIHEFHQQHHYTDKWTSLTKPKNIKEAMLDHSWIESMQDELNQFK